jgi:hypothetical protein
MARAPASPIDPAADAAALLRRLAFVILFLVMPSAALVARRALVILVPIGLVLLLLAAVLDGENRPWRRTLEGFTQHPAALAVAVLVGWSALSLAWTPYVAPAIERLLNLIAIIGLALAGYAALPDRIRTANLYIVTVGVAAASVAALGIGLSGQVEVGFGLQSALARGLVVLSLLVWPAVAWLRSRGRHGEALATALLVAGAAALGPDPLPLAALAVGAAIYACATLRPRPVASGFSWLMAGLVLLGPLLPFVSRALAKTLFGRDDPLTAGLGVWRRVILNDPVRLITGHGLDTSTRNRLAGFLPQNTPETALFEIWYEFGIVGAAATAVALFFAARRAGREAPTLVPGLLAAFATAFTLACLGIALVEVWWLTALAVVALAFAAGERGQFRTRRPRLWLRRTPANDP